MKTITRYIHQVLLIMLFVGITTITSTAAHLYHPADRPYWVVETNAKTKDLTVIKFYNQANQLVYEEKLTGIHLDIRRKKNIKMLNRTLKMVTGNALVAGQIKGYSNLIAASIATKRE